MGNQRNPEGSGPLIALAVAAVFLALYFGYTLTGNPPAGAINPSGNPNFTMLFYLLGKAFYLCVAGAIAAAAACAGYRALMMLRLDGLPIVEATVAALGIGLGALSLITLALGLAGLLKFQAVPLLVITLFALFGAGSAKAWVRRLRESQHTAWSAAEKAFGALAAIAAAWTLVYAFNPPMDYDVLEYHLGAPAYWFQHGAIRYIQYNVYSNFPSNMEMLYLFSMSLTGAKLAGAIAGKALNAYIAIAAAGAAFALGRWMLSRGAGLFAAMALLATGVFFHAAAGGYVEPLQVLYTVLALLAVGRFIEDGRWGTLALGAIATGIAMGVKYTAAPFTAAPLALAVLLARGSAAQRAKRFVAFSAIAAAVVSPWLIKNLAMTGNPFYPLLYGVFGGNDWSALQDARWQFAHTPKGGLGWEQWQRHVFWKLFSNSDEMISLLAVMFVPAVFAARAASRRVLLVLGYGLVYLFLWFATTHRIERFMLPGLAALAAVSGVGLFALPKGIARGFLSGVAAALALMNILFLAGSYGQAARIDLSVPLFGEYGKYLKANLPGYDAWEYMNGNVSPGEKVLLVGEAQVFYLDCDYLGGTVFDRKPLDEMIDKAGGDPARVADEIRASGARYVFVNWPEVSRLQRSYRFSYDGREHQGYSDALTPALFDAMASAGRIRAVYSSGAQIDKDAHPDMRAYTLYSVE